MAIQSISLNLEKLPGEILGSVQDSLHRAMEIAREQNILAGHEDYVYSVAISPDGQTIVSGCDDKTVRLWQVGWRACLEVCCNRLRYHPVFKNPQTEVEKQACETCQKYVWSREES